MKVCAASKIDLPASRSCLENSTIRIAFLLDMLPALAGMLTGGALADRCRKARLMALLDLVTADVNLSYYSTYNPLHNKKEQPNFLDCSLFITSMISAKYAQSL